MSFATDFARFFASESLELGQFWARGFLIHPLHLADTIGSCFFRRAVGWAYEPIARSRREGPPGPLDEPTALPDGTVLDLVLDDDGDELSDSEREALHAALTQSLGSLDKGLGKPSSRIIEDLRSRRCAHIITTPAADGHIRAIDEWWRINRPAAPDLFAEELADCFALLEQLPRIGKRHGRYPSVPDLRRALLRSYVYYVVRGDTVAVLAVWHSQRGQLPRL